MRVGTGSGDERATPAGCVGTETLVDFLQAPADPARRARIEEHASRCAACRAVLSALARSGTPAAGPLAVRHTGGLAPGTRIGRYVIAHEIGAGGMGVVHAAHDPELARVVAVKLMHGDGDPRLEPRLRREAQAMAQLAHPNVVAIYDVGAFDGRMFIAMEHVAGDHLARWLAAAPRSWREILAVFCDAGRGLAAAHAAGIVHRDFKPENVLIGSDGRVRVGDFGLARATRPDGGDGDGGGNDGGDGGNGGSDGDGTAGADPAPTTEPAAHGLTLPGTLLGTPYYMAPELYAGRDADARSDQFSFCVALFTALYGERPAVGDTVAEPAERTGPAAPPPARPAVPRVPRRVRAAIERGLAADPATRFASLDELLDELTRPRRRARWTLVSAAALALGIAGALMARSSANGERSGPPAALLAAASTTPAELGWTALDPATASPAVPASTAVITSANGGPCPVGFVCLYQDANRRGFGIGVARGGSLPDLMRVRCPSCNHRGPPRDGTFIKQMTSWENRSGQRYCWSIDPAPHPTDHTMGADDVTNLLDSENDTASSVGPC